jgi:hypothetical protein
MKATGVGEKDAAKHVARALKKGGVDNIDATNILSWRDKFMRGHSGPGSDWYQKFLELEVESDPTIRARIALGWAVWFGRFFPASREV